MIYPPAEDSFFLAKEVEKYLAKLSREKRLQLKILDLGAGSGIQSENLLKSGIKRKQILASDINSEAQKYLKKLKIKFVKSDLLANIKEKFDLIIFNPPYLPKNKYDKEKDTSGGVVGDEIILKFLKQVKSNLSGQIFLLLSSYTPKNKILGEIKKQKLKKKKLAEKKLFFENLEIWTISS